MKTKEYRAQLAESFLHVLEEKQLEWKKEWQASGRFQAPVNGRTGYRYRGINQFYLMMISAAREYQDNRWCTFNQIKDKGWKLVNAKGQGVQVEYWFPYNTEERKSISWEELRRRHEKIGDRYTLRVNYKTVFNGSLIEGMPELPVPEQKNISPDILIKKLSNNMGVPIINDGEDRAFYVPSEDAIHLPLPEYFETEYAYDSTALHELAHSTGAPHRLNRDLSGIFGSPKYAYEELVAEISSCFMSANLQVEQSENHIRNHKAYVQNWIQMIKEKPETLVRAVQQAEKMASYMEYKAELIERKEYEQIENSSRNVAETLLEESHIRQSKETSVSIMEFFDCLEKNDMQGMSNIIEKTKLEIKEPVFTVNYNALKYQEATWDVDENQISIRFFNGWEPMQVISPNDYIEQKIEAVVYENGNVAAIRTLHELSSKSLENIGKNYQIMLEKWKQVTKQDSILIPRKEDPSINMEEQNLVYVENQQNGETPSEKSREELKSIFYRKEPVNMEEQENTLKEMIGRLPEKGWKLYENGMEYSLTFEGEIYASGSKETVSDVVKRLLEEPTRRQRMGKALKHLRQEYRLTEKQLAGMTFLTEQELIAIEEGNLRPDKATLGLLSNIFQVFSEELENGNVVPKMSRQELSKLMIDMQKDIKEIRENTQYFRKFLEKYEISEEKIDKKGKEFYVVEDQKTGDIIKGQNGRELQWKEKEDAERVAFNLNNESELSMAEDIVREYEHSIQRPDRESVLKYYSEEQVVTYAAMCQRYLDFGREVEQCMQKKIPMREAVKVCDTPDVFVQTGCRRLPMHITQSHLRDCMHIKDSRNAHYHGLTLEEVKRLPEALENPAVIAESLTRNDSIITVLGYRESNGDPVMVSIVPNGQATYMLKRVDSNFITSMYGRENLEQFVARLIEKEKLIFINKEKSQELALLPLQLRQDHPAPAFDTIIKRFDENVNVGEKPTEEKTVKQPFLKV